MLFLFDDSSNFCFIIIINNLKIFFIIHCRININLLLKLLDL